MTREHEMDWYVGKLVRLSRDVSTRIRTYRRGRVFRVANHHRGRVNLCRPSATYMTYHGDSPAIRQVHFACIELLSDDQQPGWCRVCGCIDADGCPPDAFGKSCFWMDGQKRLCNHCARAICGDCRKGHFSPEVGCDHPTVVAVMGRATACDMPCSRDDGRQTGS